MAVRADSERSCVFFERPYPSANAILLLGASPVLVDPGFGSDIADLFEWLTRHGVPPEQLALVVNTHYHSDHVGGNRALQERGVRIAAHDSDAKLVNSRDPNVCAAAWLRQPVEAYTVDISLSEGDIIDTGSTKWRVLHTPGHTMGHVSLFEPESAILVVGDAVHKADVGWLNPALEGADVLAQSLQSIDRLARLKPRLAYSGHGPVLLDPAAAFEKGRQRLERWLSDSTGAACHAARRIFAYALMIEGGLPADHVADYFADSPWAHHLAADPFATTVDRFAQRLLDDMVRSGAVTWRDNRLIASVAHKHTEPGWARSPVVPSQWL
jgi:hydroxyacylglutathione hydrolase